MQNVIKGEWNKMKKLIAFVVLSAVLLSMAYALDNQQKIHSTDSEVFEAIKYLHIIQGHALPSTTGPWSQAELAMMLERIDRSGLSESGARVYDFASSKLGIKPKLDGKRIAMSFGMQLSPEGYFHTTVDSAFLGAENWPYSTNNRKQFLTMPWETWVGENIYSYFELALRNNIHAGSPNELDIGNGKLAINAPCFQNLYFDFDNLDMNFPDRAIVSAGGDCWSVELGKDRISWGAGETGNLTISDTLPHHNMARFAAFSSRYKYTFLTSFFPHPMNYASNITADWGLGSQSDLNKGLSFYMAHRIEGRFFSDKLSLTLTEAIMYMSEDNQVDLRVLNPVAFFHNYYIRANANSTLALEADFTPFSGLNIYGQAIVDEFAVPGEPTPKTDADAFPTAFGFLMGVKTAFALGDGIFHASMEAAKTDPFLYLRGKGITEAAQTKGEYGINYVVAFRTFSPYHGTKFDEYFLGYKYGGDAKVLNINAGWKLFGKFSITGNLFLMAHGTFDKWTGWTKIGNGSEPAYPYWEDVQTPTTTHAGIANHKDDSVNLRDSVSYTTVAGLNAAYSLLPSLGVFVQGDYIVINNYKNVSSNGTKSDFQLTFGMNYSL